MTLDWDEYSKELDATEAEAIKYAEEHPVEGTWLDGYRKGVQEATEAVRARLCGMSSQCFG